MLSQVRQTVITYESSFKRYVSAQRWLLQYLLTIELLHYSYSIFYPRTAERHEYTVTANDTITHRYFGGG